MDGWMDGLQFCVLFNRTSVISRRWAGDNEGLCAMKLRSTKHIFQRESNMGPQEI